MKIVSRKSISLQSGYAITLVCREQGGARRSGRRRRLLLPAELGLSQIEYEGGFKVFWGLDKFYGC